MNTIHELNGQHYILQGSHLVPLTTTGQVNANTSVPIRDATGGQAQPALGVTGTHLSAPGHLQQQGTTTNSAMGPHMSMLPQPQLGQARYSTPKQPPHLQTVNSGKTVAQLLALRTPVNEATAKTEKLPAAQAGRSQVSQQVSVATSTPVVRQAPMATSSPKARQVSFATSAVPRQLALVNSTPGPPHGQALASPPPVRRVTSLLAGSKQAVPRITTGTDTPIITRPAATPTPSAPPSASSSRFIKGQEYEICYANGRVVMGEYDGKYFKVKTANMGSLSAGQCMPFSNCIYHV